MYILNGLEWSLCHQLELKALTTIPYIRVPSPVDGSGVAHTAIECAPVLSRARETGNARGVPEEGCSQR
jgi:hypothetical protein